jgi:hypothetical protein
VQLTEAGWIAAHGALPRMPDGVAYVREAAEPDPFLITGHDAESHSRRGDECRLCGGPVVDHASVCLTDGVAVSIWQGTQYGHVRNEARIALIRETKLRRINEARMADTCADCDALPVRVSEGDHYGESKPRCIRHARPVPDVDTHADYLARKAVALPAGPWCEACGKPQGANCASHDVTPDPDSFLADAYAQLPISATPWQCMLCGATFAELSDLNAHKDATHADPDDLVSVFGRPVPSSLAQKLGVINPKPWVVPDADDELTTVTIGAECCEPAHPGYLLPWAVPFRASNKRKASVGRRNRKGK